MTAIAYRIGNKHCECVKDNSTPDKIATLSAVLIDIAATITFLVVGILGATGVIGMSPAAAYSLIGVGSLLFLAYAGICTLIQCTD